MPLGEIAGDFLAGMIRLVASVLFEVVVVFLFEGMGRIVLRSFRLKTEPSDTTYATVGFIFWAVVAVAVIILAT